MIREWIKRIRDYPRLEGELREIERRVVFLDGFSSATQKDKPSPSSHLSVEYWRNWLEYERPRSQGWFVTMMSDTNSMEPLLDTNSVVLWVDLRTTEGQATIEFEPLRVGDVCGYYTKSLGVGVTIVAHEIVEIDRKNKLYKFKGYNNWAGDVGWVKEENIILRFAGLFVGKKLKEGD